ncbi:formylglycine-generating enzyme family protein [Synechococcus sp. CBW1107]|uniref:formylglycine-generating enzyme family protein n=1 Tax=Synechococcus sp. CBW1107 TaxID=2789857 RepID=UPI002AD460DF|nr:formylglycine-generating enzyme family protein [Synechococcus sp. CBW1107]
MAPSVARAETLCPPEMVPIPAGAFRMGAAGELSEEAEARVRLRPFCLGRREVTNREFAAFVAATGYLTVAEQPLSTEQFPGLSDDERRPGSVVFRQPASGEPVQELSWWQWVPGADWRHPEGPGSSIEARLDHPVVQVALADAEAYAAWAGAELPSEAQWEFAARGGLRDQVFSWGNTWQPDQANTWQGEFPRTNSLADGYAGTAPVGSFPANGYGLLDMTGNVWEWTLDWYRPGHDRLAGQEDPVLTDAADSSDPRDPGVAKHVIKGGSFLCAPNYCSRYRPAAREAESPDTGTSHIGFRLASQPLDAPLETHG